MGLEGVLFFLALTCPSCERSARWQVLRQDFGATRGNDLDEVAASSSSRFLFASSLEILIKRDLLRFAIGKIGSTVV